MLLPALRPLRLLRLVTVISVFSRYAGSALRGKVTIYTVFIAAVLTFTGALAILDAEQNAPEANITSFADALWWAVVTITTVGYGDHYPVTDLGRLIAVAVMICGLGLLGTVTATLASRFVEKVGETAHAGQAQSADPSR